MRSAQHVFYPTASSHCPQMLAFKKADLEGQRENLSAYTAPTHNLQSIAASARRFLDRTVNRTLVPTELTDVTTLACSPLDAGVGSHDMVLDGLQLELDTYLHEPLMVPFKEVAHDSGPGHHVVCCNPLQYWMVSILSRSNQPFSPALVGRRKEVPIPFSARDGHPPGTSFRSCLRAAFLIKQGNMHSPPKPHKLRSNGSAPNPQVFVSF